MTTTSKEKLFPARQRCKRAVRKAMPLSGRGLGQISLTSVKTAWATVPADVALSMS